MEPERKIEKLLRAYAKKRRAQSGDPLELHPADRRILQDEVARKSPKSSEENSSLTLWELFRLQWATLLSFALIIFCGATLFLPALSSAKKKAQTSVEINNLKQIGVAVQMAAAENDSRLPATLDALTNGLVSDNILTEPESGKRFIYTAGGENLDDLSSNSVLAYSPTDKKDRAVLFADGRVEVVTASKFSELTNRGSPELAVASDSTRRQPAETSAPITVAGGNAGAAAIISGQLKTATFGSAAPSARSKLALDFPAASQNSTTGFQNYFKNTAAPIKAVPVLANFQVQQNGNAIRVVDADGSVYDGSLQSESAVEQNPLALAPRPPPSGNAQVQVEQEKAIANRSESQTAQNYFFRVSGRNQTLNQNVVFTGNLLANSNATTNLQQSLNGIGNLSGGGNFGGSRSQTALANQPQQLPWSNSRIAGTAVIADTNNIEINAVQQSP
jgi:hypothetical protein